MKPPPLLPLTLSLSPVVFLSVCLSFSLEAQESRSNKSGLNSVNPFINPRGGIGFKASDEPPFQPSFSFLRARGIRQIRRAGTYQLVVNATVHILYFFCFYPPPSLFYFFFFIFLLLVSSFLAGFVSSGCFFPDETGECGIR